MPKTKVAIRINNEIGDDGISIHPVKQGGNVHINGLSDLTYKFSFDYIFKESSQKNLFDTFALPSIDNSLNEFQDVTFLTYGQHHSGKTHTIFGDCDSLGNLETQGIVPRAIKQIFMKMSQRVEEEYKLKVSFLEIRNEAVRDLLCKNDCLKSRPSVGRTPITTTVNSVDESLRVLQKALSKRTADEETKRILPSHCIFTIMIEITDIGGNTRNVRMVFADLSGFESREKSITFPMDPDEHRIRRSLSCILKVLKQSKKRNGGFVGYRDSKLTLHLKDGFKEGVEILVIGCVLDKKADKKATLNTFHFSSDMKKLSNGNKAMRLKSESQASVCSIDIKQFSPALQQYIQEEIDKRAKSAMNRFKSNLDKEGINAEELCCTEINGIEELKEEIEEIERCISSLSQENESLGDTEPKQVTFLIDRVKELENELDNLKKKKKSLIRFWAQKPGENGQELESNSLNTKEKMKYFEENSNVKDVFYTIHDIDFETQLELVDSPCEDERDICLVGDHFMENRNIFNNFIESHASLSFFDMEFDIDNRYQDKCIENNHLNSTCYLTIDDCPTFPNEICETILEKDETYNLDNNKVDCSMLEFLCTDDSGSDESIHGCDREVACITSTLRSHEIDELKSMEKEEEERSNGIVLLKKVESFNDREQMDRSKSGKADADAKNSSPSDMSFNMSPLNAIEPINNIRSTYNNNNNNNNSSSMRNHERSKSKMSKDFGKCKYDDIQPIVPCIVDSSDMSEIELPKLENFESFSTVSKKSSYCQQGVVPPSPNLVIISSLNHQEVINILSSSHSIIMSDNFDQRHQMYIDEKKDAKTANHSKACLSNNMFKVKKVKNWLVKKMKNGL